MYSKLRHGVSTYISGVCPVEVGDLKLHRPDSRVVVSHRIQNSKHAQSQKQCKVTQDTMTAVSVHAAQVPLWLNRYDPRECEGDEA